ncbi:MAG: hypothetical protein LBI56_04020 [Puniceicoccales bacterium]|jgi:hypothetical protein|nr:hypothetical protein [Puniceicoccales bacterium]
MHIGLKNGNIVVFSETLNELQANAAIRGIILDSTEETGEEIVPYYNTSNDGIYYRKSQVPSVPVEIANEENRKQRQTLYGQLSDPLTSEISVLRDKIEMGDFASEDEQKQIEDEIERLYEERQSIREQIIAENPFIQ